MTAADILALRLALNLSQVDFGRRFRPPITGNTVSRWERGVTAPQYRELLRLRRLARRVVKEKVG